MTKELWINLPVKDVKRSKEFFTQLGFSFDTKYGNSDHSVGMVIGTKRIVVMLFEESRFKTVIQSNLTDTTKSSEVMFSFDAETQQEVDEMAKKVEAAGGNLFAKPSEIQGWMYGCAFTDPDGHRWNILYMDMNKMPK